MRNTKASEFMKILEQATAKLEAGEEVEWSWLTEVLGLPLRYIPAVQLALAQGRWRTAKNPKAYLRKVARREAAKMESSGEQRGTLNIPQNVYDEVGQPLSQQEYIDHLSYADGAVKNGGVWRARNPWDEAVWVDDHGRVLPVVNGRPVPEHLLMPEDDEPDAKLVINWQRVAREANLDSEERYILALRCVGCTRADILNKLARDEEDRRRRQAAWRRLERHMDRIRAVLGGGEN